MAKASIERRKVTLDKDLGKLVEVEEAASLLARSLSGTGIALLFLALVTVTASIYFSGQPSAIIIVAAAALGGYMALNIGANDVANNVGPAVGAKALTMGGALLLAATFESAGALIAGGDVVNTISKGIVDPATIDADTFVWLMLAALMSSALWINLATAIGAPVSTTHSVVGGVLGAGLSAAGFAAVDWMVMAGIAASWVISPVLGGIVAAAFLAFIKAFIIYQDDKIAAARRWVPVLIAVMAGAFASYLFVKGLKRLMEPSAWQVVMIGAAAFLATWAVSHRRIRRQSEGMENRNQSLRRLFTIPLICSAALLSFAHGANDVANAVGPLAAIVGTVTTNNMASSVSIPLWVMLIGAVGISLGLLLFGPRLIKMVGEQITRLNPLRAFCVALSAAVTVIVASGLGLPVSSTHIAVGAVFGVGFFREWYTANSTRRRSYLERKAKQQKRPASKGAVKPAHGNDEGASAGLSREEIKRRRLVRRSHVMTIVAAWVITVPATAVVAALIFFTLDSLF